MDTEEDTTVMVMVMVTATVIMDKAGDLIDLII